MTKYQEDGLRYNSARNTPTIYAILMAYIKQSTRFKSAAFNLSGLSRSHCPTRLYINIGIGIFLYMNAMASCVAGIAIF